MSSTHLLGNKLVSSEKPGWVAATAKGGGVLRQYLQGVGEQGQAKALALPLQLPDREGGTLDSLWTQLPTPTLCICRLCLKPLPANEPGCPVGRALSLGSQGHRHQMGQNPTVSQQQRQPSKKRRYPCSRRVSQRAQWGGGSRSSSSGTQMIGGGDANQGGVGVRRGPLWVLWPLQCSL